MERWYVGTLQKMLDNMLSMDCGTLVCYKKSYPK